MSYEEHMKEILEKMQKYKLSYKIIDQKGYCNAGHKVGQEGEISVFNPGGLCGFFYHTAFPDIQTLQFGGRMPWETDEHVAHCVCPDGANLVTCEIRRRPAT